MFIDSIVQKIGLFIFVFAIIIGLLFALQLGGELGKLIANLFTLL